MADKSKIEWTDATWNPLRGCSRVSEGCRHCYAEGVAARFSGPGLPYEGLAKRVTRPDGSTEARWTGKVAFSGDEVLTQPLRWKKPRRIFVNSMSDLFHESVPDEWIDRIFAVMALCPQHTFQVLTKRPERMREYLSDRGADRRVHELACDMTVEWQLRVVLIARREREAFAPAGPRIYLDLWPLPNVWLGVSVEDQPTADTRIPYLLQTPAAVRFISAEPLLGPVDLVLSYGKWPLDALNGWTQNTVSDHYPIDGIDWVIVGGESGADARPMHPDWARSLRDQCAAAGVPFFYKQWGEFSDFDHIGMLWNDLPDRLRQQQQFVSGKAMIRIGKHRAGRLLDGIEHNGMPG